MSVTEKRRSTAAPVAAVVGAVLVLTACSSSPGGSANPTPPPSAPASRSTPADAGAAGASSGGASPGNVTTAPAGQGGGSALAPCTTDRLKVSQENQDVGAGQYHSTLAFTNHSRTSCTLTGYPGVSYVGANGVQSGNAAVRDRSTRVTTVTLAPGGTASAALHDSNGEGGFSPQQCALAPAEGLRIYPPGQRTALFLPWKTSHCAGRSVESLTIGPVQR